MGWKEKRFGVTGRMRQDTPLIFASCNKASKLLVVPYPMHFTLLTSVSGDFSLTAGSSEGEDSSLEVAWLSTEELKKNSGNNVLLWTGRVLVTHIRDGSGTGDGARVVV